MCEIQVKSKSKNAKIAQIFVILLYYFLKIDENLSDFCILWLGFLVIHRSPSSELSTNVQNKIFLFFQVLGGGSRHRFRKKNLGMVGEVCINHFICIICPLFVSFYEKHSIWNNNVSWKRGEISILCDFLRNFLLNRNFYIT